MDSLLTGLENFESVWARVNSSPAEKNEPAEAKCATVEHIYSDKSCLAELINLSFKNIRLYRALTRRCRGQICGALRRLSLDENTRLKKLQTEYFLLTGDSYAPSNYFPADGGILNVLRDAYLNETESARFYLVQSEKTENIGLRELYFDFSGAASLHAEKLRRIIEKVM